MIRQVLGPQYDLVTFDPRGMLRIPLLHVVRRLILSLYLGVGQTTPPLAIFDSSIEAGIFYSTYPSNFNESVSSLGRGYALNQIRGNIAVDRAEKVAASMSTPAVARDMLNMVEAFGRDKLSYWGFS